MLIFTDPLFDLFSSLIENGKPDLAWVIREQQHGLDPLASIWPRTIDVSAMANVLRLAGTDPQHRFARLAMSSLGRLGNMGEIDRDHGYVYGWQTKPKPNPFTGDYEFTYGVFQLDQLSEKEISRASSAASELRTHVPIPPTLDKLIAAWRVGVICR